MEKTKWLCVEGILVQKDQIVSRHISEICDSYFITCELKNGKNVCVLPFSTKYQYARATLKEIHDALKD